MGYVSAVVSILFAQGAMASTPNCSVDSAEIKAKVVRVEHVTESGFARYCRVFITLDSKNTLFSPNALCPIDIEDVSSYGVLVVKDPGTNDCLYKTGDAVSGYITDLSGDSKHIELED